MYLLQKRFSFAQKEIDSRRREESDKYSNELSKDHSKAIQGMALLFMLALHLFCRRDNLPYSTNLYINNVPVLYYLGLWGDQCVALFCFCAGYASYLQQEKYENKAYIKYSGKRVIKLLINFWIVVFLFSLIGMIAGRGDVIPGSLTKLLGNLFLFNISYNGAWWFLFTYVILLILSPLLYQIVRDKNGIIVIFMIGIIYFISYIIRFYSIYIPDMRVIFNWCITQSALLGTSILPYVWGMLFYKNKVISNLRKRGGRLSGFAIFVLSIIAFGVCIVTHGFEESLIIAPIYAMITVCVISLWNGKAITFLKFVGEHSTNMWLTHMFFYLVLFEDFIFVFKYPFLIYVMMLALCLVSSYIINFLLYRTVVKIKILN